MSLSPALLDRWKANLAAAPKEDEEIAAKVFTRYQQRYPLTGWLARDHKETLTLYIREALIEFRGRQ